MGARRLNDGIDLPDPLRVATADFTTFQQALALAQFPFMHPIPDGIGEESEENEHEAHSEE